MIWEWGMGNWELGIGNFNWFPGYASEPMSTGSASLWEPKNSMPSLLHCVPRLCLVTNNYSTFQVSEVQRNRVS